MSGLPLRSARCVGILSVVAAAALLCNGRANAQVGEPGAQSTEPSAQGSRVQSPLAQGEKIETQDELSRWQRGPTSGGLPSGRAVARGRVLFTETPKGVVAVRTDQGTLTLSAEPSDIAGLQPGDTVELPYGVYGGQPWVDRNAAASGAAPTSGATAQVSGMVQTIDAPDGIIEMQGRTLRVHPRELANVTPGQYATITYADVQGTPWVTEIAVPPANVPHQHPPGWQPPG